MSQVICRDISKSYANVGVLNRVNLEVDEGEFLVMLGPSGCGKSTLLRIIAGLERQDSGSVHIGARAVDGVHPRERDVAMVFQNYALYPLMSVYENLAFSLKIRKLPAADIDRRVREVAGILGLERHFNHRPAQLSGGQRQRVAMGRAMVRNPRVFLFDEPLSNLDARLRSKVRGEIKSLHLSLSTTTIYVTHDQIEALTMGDRIMVMKDGGIEQIGTPDEVYLAPANRYVATFIGSPEINILDGVIDGGDEKVCIIDGRKFPLPAGAAPVGKILYGIRPHDLMLSAAVAGDALPIAATVEFTEPTGGAVIVHAKLGEQTIILQIAHDEGQTLAPGDAINLAVNPGRIHLFDPSSERRIIAK